MPLPPAPKGALFATTAKLPPPLQRFDATRFGAAATAAAHHVPAERRRLELAGGKASGGKPGGKPPIRWPSRSPAGCRR